MRGHRLRSLAVIAAVAASVVATVHRAEALDRSALSQVAEVVEHKMFPLKVSLHEPVIRGSEMQVPTLTPRGWIHVDDSKSVVLAAGSTVEVTGVFDYADQGLFLELAAESHGFFSEPITKRARIRIRIMVSAPIDDPGAQAKEAISLIGRVLALSRP